ncbi:helix-turn-helix domain-containing protein [Glutamicibacter sp. 287]|uniref:helix-turn-helix domain-containing protein n=1 Tax=unclassified Glutamicibacter TaxID=2627139 RepID=UPI004033C16D
MKRESTQTPGRRPKLSDEQIPQIVQCYQDGDSMRTLARRFGVHRETIGRKLRQSGVAIRTA